MKAIFCKSEALYNLCKFEYALLGYLKGSRLVPDSEAFKLGHIKCKKTINNSLTSDMFCVEDSRVVRFLDNFDMNSLYGGNVVKGKRIFHYGQLWRPVFFCRKNSVLSEKDTYYGNIKGTRNQEGKYQ